MTTKKSKKKAAVKRIELPSTLEVKDIPPEPLLRKALVAQVDNPRSWEKTGLAMQALPRYARMAALLCQGTRCHFCGVKQVEHSRETLFHFHPEYPLCACLLPHRNVAHDYITGWNTSDSAKQFMSNLENRVIKHGDIAYQYTCAMCGDGPVHIEVRLVASSIRKLGVHQRRTKCDKCFGPITRKLAVPIREVAAKPKEGPAARIKHKRKGNQPVSPPAVFTANSLPPLKVLEKGT